MVAQFLKLFLVVIAVLQVVSRANTGELCVLVLPYNSSCVRDRLGVGLSTLYRLPCMYLRAHRLIKEGFFGYLVSGTTGPYHASSIKHNLIL